MSIRPRIILVAFALAMSAGIGCSEKKESDNNKRNNKLPPFNPQPGSLEFCIVANDADDADGITAAREYFESAAKDPKNQAELKKLAEEGKPPPAPVENPKLRFSFNGVDTTFRWVEMDPNLIKEWLSKKNDQDTTAEQVAEARKKGKVALLDLYSGTKKAVWSRPCVNESLSPKERADKGFDSFVLIRNAFPGKELTKAHLSEIEPDIQGEKSRPAIKGALNDEGGKRMRELTTDNKPAKFTRQLAIIIQNKVFTAPSLNSTIGERFQISGEFTEEYVKEVVSRIRTAGR